MQTEICIFQIRSASVPSKTVSAGPVRRTLFFVRSHVTKSLPPRSSTAVSPSETQPESIAATAALCLGFYELLPFWYAFWTSLGFAVHTSPVSTRGLYLAGQATIPSDTACFPAKLSHGHIKALSQMQLDAIFYPCLTYNVDEGLGDNHYNCPVVAYYPEVLAGNCPELEGKKFIYDYVGIHRPKDFVHKMAKEVLPKYFGGISEREVQAAADAAYAEYEAHMAKIRVKGSEIIDEARRQE